MAAARGEYMTISNNYVKKENLDVMWYASNPKRDIKPHKAQSVKNIII